LGATLRRRIAGVFLLREALAFLPLGRRLRSLVLRGATWLDLSALLLRLHLCARLLMAHGASRCRLMLLAARRLCRGFAGRGFGADVLRYGK
jgi:hypothetical protein